jgi:hypothetical protein
MNDPANTAAHEKILVEIGEMKEAFGEMKGEFRGMRADITRGRDKFDELGRRLADLEQDKKRDRWVVGFFSAIGGGGVFAFIRTYFGGVGAP